MRARLLALALVAASLAACSGSSERAAEPVLRPGDGPAGGSTVTVGAVTLSLPAQMQALDGQDAGDGITKARYRSTVLDGSGRAAAVVVTVKDTADRSATAEGEALAGYQKDVAKGIGLRSGSVEWPGFDSAYGLEFDDAAAAEGEPLHHLVLVAGTTKGGLVNVTVAAPPELFESLDLQASVASLRAVAPSG